VGRLLNRNARSTNPPGAIKTKNAGTMYAAGIYRMVVFVVNEELCRFAGKRLGDARSIVTESLTDI
jgi:hypothetical protein